MALINLILNARHEADTARRELLKEPGTCEPSPTHLLEHLEAIMRYLNQMANTTQ